MTAPGGEPRSACLDGNFLAGAVEGAVDLGAALGVDFGAAGGGCRLLGDSALGATLGVDSGVADGCRFLGACRLTSVGDMRPRGARTARPDLVL